MSPEQIYGLSGERWVFNQLTRRGCNPVMPPDFFREACDLMIGALCVEVKIARQTLRQIRLADGQRAFYPRWQWRIHPASQRLECDWVCVLVAEVGNAHEVYVVPGGVLTERSNIQLTSPPDRYRGWLNQYRNEWSVIDYLLQQAYVEKLSYEEWKKTVRRAA